jgi:hypothetical protein
VGEMSACVEVAQPSGGRRPLDRLAAGLLLVLMGVGSLVLWLGLPAGVLWALSKVTESSTQHFVLAVVAVPAAMAIFAPALLWLNRLYLRLIGALRPEEDDEDRGWRLGGPLEIFLFASMAIAIGALLAWIFFLGERPPYTVW